MAEVTNSAQTETRKVDHININLQQDVSFPNRTTGLEAFRYMHRAVPELDLATIDTSVTVLGKQLRTPLLISSMTGGAGRAQQLNINLARSAQKYGLAMGLGSQRAAIEDSLLAPTYQVRDVAPDILLFANIGAVQLNYGYGVSQCQQAVDMVDADALILHFNVLQEAVQPEGDVNFSGLLRRIEAVAGAVSVPVIAKEVGWGFSPDDIRLLLDAGIRFIDVAGAGGTSWSEVEYHRAPTAFHARVARSFANWGISTADAIQYVVDTAPDATVIASGGIRDGIDVAKCITLGAGLVGLAGPFLRAADESTEAVDALVEELIAQLRVVMLCTASEDIAMLKRAELLKIQVEAGT